MSENETVSLTCYQHLLRHSLRSGQVALAEVESPIRILRAFCRAARYFLHQATDLALILQVFKLFICDPGTHHHGRDGKQDTLVVAFDLQIHEILVVLVEVDFLGEGASIEMSTDFLRVFLPLEECALLESSIVDYEC